MQEVQFVIELWQVKQLLVHKSHVFAVEFKIVPYGQIFIHALLYNIPVRQVLHKYAL